MQAVMAHCDTARRIISAGVVVLAASTFSVGNVCGQPNASYEYFRTLPQGSLASVQVKLTWGGVDLNPTSSLLFSGSGTAPTIGVFSSFGDPRLSHSNDELATPITFTVTAAQLDALLDSVAVLPQVTDTTANPVPLYGFALYDPAGGSPKAFESILSREDVKQLLGRMRGALAGNAEASAVLSNFVCANYLGIGPLPVERTSQIAIDYGGLRRNWKTGQFVGKVRVTNTSNPAIQAPIYLLVPPQKANVRLANATGHTCRIPKIHTPYVKLPVTGSLARNAFVDVELHFETPDLNPVRFTGKVFAGPGDP